METCFVSGILPDIFMPGKILLHYLNKNVILHQTKQESHHQPPFIKIFRVSLFPISAKKEH